MSDRVGSRGDPESAPPYHVDVALEAMGEHLLLETIRRLRDVARSVVGLPDHEWSHPDAEAAARFLEALHDRVAGDRL